MNWLRLVDRLSKRRVRRLTRDYLQRLTTRPEQITRERTQALLTRLLAEDHDHVTLGYTPDGQPVRVALDTLCRAHSIITGGTGAGKSRAVLLILDALLRSSQPIGFGLLDPKTETFHNVIYLIARLLVTLPEEEAAALWGRIVVIDLTRSHPNTSYNLCQPWDGTDLDSFVQARLETLQQLLPHEQGLSLRGANVVRPLLRLLTECRVPFAWINRVLDDEALRHRLLARTQDAETRSYFSVRFARESKATLAAVQSRFSSLMATEALRLALSGAAAPDYRLYQDQRKIVLINCPGAPILQQFCFDDIRPSVPARENHNPFLWVLDEAQNFFRTPQMRAAMEKLLRESRSYGSFFCCLTQNLAGAVQDGALLENLYTNCRWSLSLRGSSRDAQFLRDVLPVTGRRRKLALNPFAPAEFYSMAEERSLLFTEMSHLPDRVGWFWLRALSPEPILLRTADLDLPPPDVMRGIINKLLSNPAFGERMSRATYLAQMQEQARTLGVIEDNPADTDTLARLRERFRAQRSD